MLWRILDEAGMASSPSQVGSASLTAFHKASLFPAPHSLIALGSRGLRESSQDRGWNLINQLSWKWPEVPSFTVIPSVFIYITFPVYKALLLWASCVCWLPHFISLAVLWGGVFSFPFYRWSKEGSERLSDFLKVTQKIQNPALPGPWWGLSSNTCCSKPAVNKTVSGNS